MKNKQIWKKNIHYTSWQVWIFKNCLPAEVLLMGVHSCTVGMLLYLGGDQMCQKYQNISFALIGMFDRSLWILLWLAEWDVLVKRWINEKMNRVNTDYVTDHCNLTKVLSELTHHHSISIIQRKAFLHFRSLQQIILWASVYERECVNVCPLLYYIFHFGLLRV